MFLKLYTSKCKGTMFKKNVFDEFYLINLYLVFKKFEKITTNRSKVTTTICMLVGYCYNLESILNIYLIRMPLLMIFI